MPSRLIVTSRAAAALYASTLRLLPLLYFVWAVLVGSVVAYVTPPWQNPDEGAHVGRAIQIAHGELLGRRLNPHSAGGTADVAVLQSDGAVGSLRTQPDTRLTAKALRDAVAIRWGKLSPVGFDNTATYPPMLYAATALAELVGRASRMHAVATLHVMRLANLVTAAAIGAAALAAARRTRLALAAILLLPMSLAMAASPGQDALVIPLSVWAVAAVDRARNGGDTTEGTGRDLAVALALLLVVLARPPYLPLALLLLAWPGRMGRRAALALGIGVLAVLWSAFVAWRVSVPMNVADPGRQAAFLLAHPFRFVGIVNATARDWAQSWLSEAIGTFGWLAAPLPGHFVRAVRFGMVLPLVSACVPDRLTGGLWRHRSFVAAIAVGGSVLAIMLSLYVIWTAPEAARVGGIQGRYFLPLLPALALGMPNCGRWAAVLRPPALAAVLLLAVVGPAVTVTTLVDRYYLQP